MSLALLPHTTSDAVSNRAASDFIGAFAGALQSAGAPAHRLEAAVDHAAQALGVDVSCSATPTGLWINTPTGSHMLRVSAGECDLGRLVALDQVGQQVARGELQAHDGSLALAAIDQAAPLYPRWLILLADAAAAGGVSAFFAGSPTEIGLSAALGTVGGLLASTGRAAPLLSALVASAAATLAASFAPISAPLVTLAALINYLPGFSLTTAMGELSLGHLAAGTARLAGVFTRFLMLGVGALLGWRILDGLGVADLGLPRIVVHWPEAPIVLLFGLALVVAFKARPRDAHLVLAGCFVAWGAGNLGDLLVGPDIGAALGAFAAGLVGNAIGRWRNLPASVVVFPGILMLVPGSIGFRSVRDLLGADVLLGVAQFAQMFLVAGGLVSGLLLANLLLPPKRDL
jgi:uncharacterized membrane protein YjjP (DUF1212 family)